jgi:biotin carboxylase
MTRTLLLIGGGDESLPILTRAQEMSLHCVVVDGNERAPAREVADGFVHCSIYDYKGIVAATKGRGWEYGKRPFFDGILCAATDAAETVEGVVSELYHGLGPYEDGLGPEDKIASLFVRYVTGVGGKQETRLALMRGGLRTPHTWMFDAPDDILSDAKGRGIIRVVVKPDDSRGARGVSLVPLNDNAPEALGAAFALARAVSPVGHALAEQFLPGLQLSTEAVIVDGVSHLVGVSDRNYDFSRFAPHIIEDGSDMPSRILPAQWEAVAETMQAAAKAIGLQNGTLKGDLVMVDGEPYVIEVAPRLSGGCFCAPMIPLSTGVDLVGAAIRLALGEKPEARELRPRYHRGVCQRYFFPPPGKVVAIEGAKEARGYAGVQMLLMRAKVGDVVGPYTHHATRPGMVIATGKTREEAMSRAEAAVDRVRIVTEGVDGDEG